MLNKILSRVSWTAFRTYASKPKTKTQTDKSCDKPAAVPEEPCCKGSWGGFFKEKSKAPPAEKCCRPPPREDPDLSYFGGQPFKSCGSAYVIQKDIAPEDEYTISEEEKLVKQMEIHPNLKGSTDDPMPPFRTVEQRLLDLSEKRLHPLYKMYMSINRHHPDSCDEILENQVKPPAYYQSRSGPIDPAEIPERLKIARECLERKNIFSDFKRVQLPRQLLAQMAEMNLNRRPTLERRQREKMMEEQRKKEEDAAKECEPPVPCPSKK